MKNSIRNLAMLGLAAGLALTGSVRAAEGESNANDEAMEELRATLGNMSAQLNDLKSNEGKAVKWGINTDLRYDYQPYAAATAASPAKPLAVPYTTANGVVGMYAKRVELEATGKINEDAEWNLQFDFVGLKVEDLGVDAKNLSLLPFVSVSGYTWEAKLGLYRQAFGLENQVGSSSTPFPERAMINGGANPEKYGKLAYERAMGLQMIQSHSFGPIGYKLQLEAANNVKDQDPGSPTGGQFVGGSTDSMGLKTDQDPTEMGRLGIDLNFFPSIAKLNLGASALHNSVNTALMTADPTKQFWNDNIGYDATLVIPIVQSTVWAEWVSQNNFKNSPLAGTFINRQEGWYVVNTMKPLAFFNKDWTQLDLNMRLESFVNDVDAAANAAPWQVSSEQAASIGLKYYYAGKTYTSINYTAYGLNGDYSAVGAGSLLVLQQQFNY